MALTRGPSESVPTLPTQVGGVVPLSPEVARPRRVGATLGSLQGTGTGSGPGSGTGTGSGTGSGSTCTTDTYFGWPSTFFRSHCSRCHHHSGRFGHSDVNSRASSVASYISGGYLPTDETGRDPEQRRPDPHHHLPQLRSSLIWEELTAAPHPCCGRPGVRPPNRRRPQPAGTARSLAQARRASIFSRMVTLSGLVAPSSPST